MKAAILFLSLVVLVAAAPAHDIEAQIDAANAKWIEAFNKGDAAAIGQLYTEHATALPPGAPMASGRAAVQAVWQGAIQSGVKNITLKTLKVDQFGNAAREIGEFTLDQPNAQKQMVHVEGKYVVLWRHLRGGWKLDTDIWNTNQ
jgi:ketosteroid isomerase-like protein